VRLLRALRVPAIVFLLGVIMACAPTQVLIGTARTPINPADVVIYPAAPPGFESIAVIRATSRSLISTGGAGAIDKVVQRLKEHAARLGANGLILDDFDDEQPVSLGAGVSSDSYTHNGSISLGIRGLFGLFQKTGTARAIYVGAR